MQKIYKYQLVKEYDTSVLENVVQGMIEKGWQPFGNLISFHWPDTGGVVYFVQPMVIFN